jgi:hypothetical protein
LCESIEGDVYQQTRATGRGAFHRSIAFSGDRALARATFPFCATETLFKYSRKLHSPWEKHWATASVLSVGGQQPEGKMSSSIRAHALPLLVAAFAISLLFQQQAIHAQSGPTTTVATPATRYPAEASFLAENSSAMDTMMKGMDVKPTGDIDADFAAMMIPHHQGAIDMALSELRYGKNEQLRRIAQEIIVEQQQEINAMHLALGQPLSPDAPAPTQVTSSQPPAAVPDHAATPHDGMSIMPMK